MTQLDMITRHLNDYGSITALEAVNEYGIMRLAARIHDLRETGMVISAETETSKNRYGEKVSYTRYRLEQ